MSEQESHIGKAKLLIGETPESLCEKLGIRKTMDSLSAREMIYDNYREKYIIDKNNNVYEIIGDKDLSYNNIYYATKKEDGTIEYVLSYYNGACSFSEAFEEAIKKIKD